MRIKLFFVACFMALAGLATTATAQSTDTPKQAAARAAVDAIEVRIRKLDEELQKRRKNDDKKTNKRINVLLRELHIAYVTADSIRYYNGLDKYQTKHRTPRERVAFEINRIMEIQKKIDHYKSMGTENAKSQVSNKTKFALNEALVRKAKVLARVEAHRAKMIKRYAADLGIESTMK